MNEWTHSFEKNTMQISQVLSNILFKKRKYPQMTKESKTNDQGLSVKYTYTDIYSLKWIFFSFF